MRHRLRGRRAQLRNRFHYLWRDLDSAGDERILGSLSLSFTLILLWPHQDSTVPHPPWVWGTVALVAGVLMLVGVVTEVRWSRIVGLILGTGFWITFAIIYGFVSDTPLWVPYTVLALTHVWALRQVVRP